MPVTNTWYIENRVLMTRLTGLVTIDELTENAKIGTMMIDSGESPVYNLIDMTDLKSFPFKLNDISQIIAQGASDKLQWMILYGIPNPLVNFLATMFTQISRKNYRVVNNFEEAWNIIKHFEPKLAESVSEHNL